MHTKQTKRHIWQKIALVGLSVITLLSTLILPTSAVAFDPEVYTAGMRPEITVQYSDGSVSQSLVTNVVAGANVKGQTSIATNGINSIKTAIQSQTEITNGYRIDSSFNVTNVNQVEGFVATANEFYADGDIKIVVPEEIGLELYIYYNVYFGGETFDGFVSKTEISPRGQANTIKILDINDIIALIPDNNLDAISCVLVREFRVEGTIINEPEPEPDPEPDPEGYWIEGGTYILNEVLTPWDFNHLLICSVDPLADPSSARQHYQFRADSGGLSLWVKFVDGTTKYPIRYSITPTLPSTSAFRTVTIPTQQTTEEFYAWWGNNAVLVEPEPDPEPDPEGYWIESAWYLFNETLTPFPIDILDKGDTYTFQLVPEQYSYSDSPYKIDFERDSIGSFDMKYYYKGGSTSYVLSGGQEFLNEGYRYVNVEGRRQVDEYFYNWWQENTTITNAPTQYIDTSSTYSNYTQIFSYNYAVWTNSVHKQLHHSYYTDWVVPRLSNSDTEGGYWEGWTVGYDVGYENGFGEGYYTGYTDGRMDVYIENEPDLTNWLSVAVGGFLSFEIIPGISFLGILGIFVSVSLALILLKFFAGG